LKLKRTYDGTIEEQAILSTENNMTFFYRGNPTAHITFQQLSLKISADFNKRELKIDGVDKKWRERRDGTYNYIVNLEFKNKIIARW
jgi:hypothetical protein